MASLMEDLLATLEGEKKIYQELIPVSERKTEILVKGDLSELETVTQEEQLLIEKAGKKKKKREAIIANIGVVLNKDVNVLDLKTLSELLAKQPEEREKLVTLHDSLKLVMRRLIEVNEQNKNLIENSLEMIEFNMNFIQSTRMSPGVNNYDRNATSTNYGYGSGLGTVGGFDAKQ